MKVYGLTNMDGAINECLSHNCGGFSVTSLMNKEQSLMAVSVECRCGRIRATSIDNELFLVRRDQLPRFSVSGAPNI